MKEKVKKLYYLLKKNRLLALILNKIVMLDKIYISDSQRARIELYNKLKLSIPVVCAGPFKGLKYYSEKRALDAIPKIIGSYELELLPITDRVLKKQYDLVIDIGAAEGYYVIGFANKWPKLKIIAYDNDPLVREELSKMLEINNVSERVLVKDFCDEKELLSLPKDVKALIISDCEGYEAELFSSNVISNLKNCDFIIEAHDGYNRNISKTLIQRFKENYKQVKVIRQKKRRIKDFPLIVNSSEFSKLASMYEGRGFWLRWLFIESNL